MINRVGLASALALALLILAGCRHNADAPDVSAVQDGLRRVLALKQAICVAKQNGDGYECAVGETGASKQLLVAVRCDASSCVYTFKDNSGGAFELRP